MYLKNQIALKQQRILNMSESTVEIALERIKSATRSSPIIAFKSKRKDVVDCYFYNTIKSREMLTTNSSNFIGIFDKYFDIAKAREVIVAAVEE
jgi:hypothetical protein